MKAIFSLLLVLFFVASTGSSRAMMSIGEVSKERAKEMGIVVISTPAGPDAARISLTFKKVGALKTFGPNLNSRVELWIRDGEKLFAHVPLQMRQASENEVTVSFVAARKVLKRMSVMVIVGAGLMSGGGYQLQMADFVDLEKLDEKKPKKTAPPAEDGGAGPPASTAVPTLPDGEWREPEVLEKKKGLPLPTKPAPSEGL